VGLIVKYLGLAIVAVLLMNIVAVATPVLAASPDNVKLVDGKQAKGLREALKAYREIIKRLLPIINASKVLSDEVKEKLIMIANLSDEDIESMSIDQLKDLITFVRHALSTIAKTNIARVNVSKYRLEITKKVMERVRELARKLGIAKKVMPLIENISMLVREGKLKDIPKLMKYLGLKIREEHCHKASKVLADVVLRRLGIIHKMIGVKVNESIKGIHNALTRINATIEMLKNLVKHLESVNASERSIEAVEQAISNLEEVTDILKSTALTLHTLKHVVPKKLWNITINITKAEISEKVNETEKELSALIQRIERLLNITKNITSPVVNETVKKLEELRTITNELLNNLSIVNELVINGSITDAIKLLVQIRFKMELVRRQVIAIEFKLAVGRTTGKIIISNIREHLMKGLEKIRELRKELSKLKVKVEKLNKTALRVQVELIEKTLDEAIEVAKEINESISEREIGEALKLLHKFDALLWRAVVKMKVLENLINIAERLVRWHIPPPPPPIKVGEVIKELNKTIERLMEEVKEVREKALSVNATKALEHLDKAMELLTNASRMLNELVKKLSEGNVTNVKVVINRVRALIIEAEHQIHIAKELLIMAGVRERVKERVREAKEELDKLMKKFNETLSKLGRKKDMFKQLIDRIKDLINDVKNLLTSIEETIKKGNIMMAKERLGKVQELLKMLENLIEELESKA